MKPSPWPIAVLVVVVVALLWWFWPRDQAPAPASAGTAKPATAASAKSDSVPTTPAAVETPAPVAATASAPAPVAAPAPKEEPLAVTVYFDFDRSALRAAEAPKLDALAAKLKDRKYARVTLAGHADRLGEAPHNDALSRKRAEAAVAYLASKGVDPARSVAEGKGERAGDACKDLGPESGSNEKLVECLQEDRRVDVAVVAE